MKTLPVLVAAMLAVLLVVTQADDEAANAPLDQVLSWGGLLVAALALLTTISGG